MPIFSTPDQLHNEHFGFAPRVLNADGSVKHVYCEGARFHVLSWSSRGRHCSEPECEVNKALDPESDLARVQMEAHNQHHE